MRTKQDAIVDAKKQNLSIISNKLNHEQRIKHRIAAFRRDMLKGDGDMAYIHEVMEIIYDYMCQYEDDDVFMAAMKQREAWFYIGDFVNR